MAIDFFLRYGFNHPTLKIPEDVYESGYETYRACMAQNGTDGVNLTFWCDKPVEGLKLSLESPRSPRGDALRAEVFQMAYIPVYGRPTPDAMMPCRGSFDIKKDRAKSFFIRLSAPKGTPEGLYEGAFRVEWEGKTVVSEKFSARVWGFALPDVPACGTLFGLKKGFIKELHNASDTEADELYKEYYDFLLANKICAYDLPFDLLDGRADAYLDDPRVTSFKIPCSKDDGVLKAYHKKLSSKPEWFKKGVFYPVDEPKTAEQFEEYRAICLRLERVYPGFQLITPLARCLIFEDDADSVAYLAPWQTRWCIRTDLFNDMGRRLTDEVKKTHPEFGSNRDAILSRFGTMLERMERERAGGDELWWYVCGYPCRMTYGDFNLSNSGASHRVLFWQQFAYGVEGLLYWSANYWKAEGAPWKNPHTFDEHRLGDGSLLYNGNEIGVDGPVGSLRLEMIRAGIDDFEMLTMAKKLLSKAELDGIISPIVNPSPSLNEALYGDGGPDIFTLCDNDDALYEARARLGRALSKNCPARPANYKGDYMKNKIELRCRFNHGTRKVMRDEQDGGFATYQAALPQNGTDGFNVTIWTNDPVDGLTFAVENPVSAEGAELKAEAFRLAYIPVRNRPTPDPMMPNTGTFSADRNFSPSFYIRVSSEKTSPPGVYTGAFRVEKDGEVQSRMEFSARVWGFALADSPACGTLFGVSKGHIKRWHGTDDAQTDELYKKYYDFVLENKVNPYYLPEDVLDDRADAYLDDPRMTSFIVPFPPEDETLRAYHKKLSSKPEWFKKGVFYPIDEPATPESFDHYKQICQRLERCYPDYKIITPIGESFMRGEENDGISQLEPYQTRWCPRSDMFGAAGTAGYFPERDRAAMTEKFGPMHERMDKERAGGDEIWWYVCGFPYMRTYCDLNMDGSGASHRVLFWQQFAYDIEGLLYWSATCWRMEEGTPWTSPFTYDKIRPGDGSLLYNGNEIGVDGPVGSLRLEMVRAGMDDFEMLTMAKELLSKAELDAVVNPIVNPSPLFNNALYGDSGPDIFTFNDNEDAFYEARTRLGDMLSAKLSGKAGKK